MGVDPEHDWKAHYEVLPGKEHVVAELKKLAKDDDESISQRTYREGEAIAWHLKEVIGGDDSRYHRVVFNEITKNAIQEAFKHPTSRLKSSQCTTSTPFLRPCWLYDFAITLGKNCPWFIGRSCSVCSC
jgi:DNA topoisomerase-1